MRMKKKGALELSINAIVILILAMTMLGIGMMFLKGTLGGVFKEFEKVSETIKNEMVERLRDSGEKTILSAFETTVKRSGKGEVYLAIRNDLNDPARVTYTLCTKDMEADGTCSAGTEPLACKTIEPASDCTDITIKTIPEVRIKPGETEVYKVKISVTSKAKADTYLVPIVVTDPAGEEKRLDLNIDVE